MTSLHLAHNLKIELMRDNQITITDGSDSQNARVYEHMEMKKVNGVAGACSARAHQVISVALQPSVT